MNEEDDIFLEQMRGVSPIKKSNRLKKENSKNITKGLKQTKTNKAKTGPTKPTKAVNKSEFILEKINIKKGIKKRSFYIDKKIDFHGKNLIESEEEFKRTILDCYNNGQRCLLFVTGKGLFKGKFNENKTQPKLYHGVIRSAFVNWVKSKEFSRHILSFEQASLEHGGDGAFYVYLRKKKN